MILKLDRASAHCRQRCQVSLRQKVHVVCVQFQLLQGTRQLQDVAKAWSMPFKLGPIIEQVELPQSGQGYYGPRSFIFKNTKEKKEQIFPHKPAST